MPDRLISRARWAGGPDPVRIGFGRRFVAATSTGSVLKPINSSIIAVALVSIGRAFGVGDDVTVWLVSVLYLATAVGQPTMGRLADRVGPRRVYLGGTALVALGGLLGFAGASFAALVAARIVIGLGTSAAYPAAMAMVRRQSRLLRRPAPGGVLGALAIAGQATMAVGPLLGGLLIAAGGWPLTFLVNVPLAVIGAALAVVWLPADGALDRGSLTWRALDPAGLLLFVAALVCVMVFLMDLSAPAWWLPAGAAVLVAALVAWELRADAPFLDVRMLGHNLALTTTYVRYAITMLVTYGFVYGWTQWLEQSAGRTASATGLLMTPSFVVAAVMSALGARARPWPALVVGAAALVAGSGGLLLLDRGTSLWALLVVGAVFGVQNGLNVVTNQAAMYSQAPGETVGTAAGLLRTFMYLGAIAAASLIGLAFGPRATDAGLHHLALILTGGSVLVLLSTLLDPNLRTVGRGIS